MNRLRPISQAEHTAARLREMARELLAQAAALEAGIDRPGRGERTDVKMIPLSELLKMSRRP